MGIAKQQFFKASVTTYVGVVLGYLNITILFPYFCSPEQLGLYRVIINMATLFAAIAYMGTPQAIVKQFALFKKQNKVDEFYGLIFLMFVSTLSLSIFLIFILENWFTEFFVDKAPQIGGFYNYSVLIAILLAVFILFTSNARLAQKVSFPTFLKDVFQRLMVLFSILALGFGYINFEGFIVLICCSYLIITITVIIYSIRQMPFRLNFNLRGVKRSSIKDTFLFSSLTFMSSISDVIILNADSLMITALSKEGLVDTGIYTIAFFIGTSIEIPRRMIILISAPIISDYWVDRKIDEINRVYRSSSLNALILGVILFGLIWVNIKFIYQFIPNSEIYITGINVVLFILIARLFELSCSLSTNVLSQTKLYIYNLPLSFGLVALSIGLNYLLIPIYGIEGAGLATMSTIIAYNLSRMLLIWFKFKQWPYSINSLKVLGLFLVGIALSYFVNLENLYINAVLRSLVILFSTAFPIYLLKLSADFNTIIDDSLRMVRGKTRN